jgi:SMC interacting uncharacterized protein involved in chromosome segregation
MDTLQEMISSNKMTHAITRDYNTEEKMANLRKKITNQMIENCKQCIYDDENSGPSGLEGAPSDVEEASSAVEEAASTVDELHLMLTKLYLMSTKLHLMSRELHLLRTKLHLMSTKLHLMSTKILPTADETASDVDETASTADEVESTADEGAGKPPASVPQGSRAQLSLIALTVETPPRRLLPRVSLTGTSAIRVSPRVDPKSACMTTAADDENHCAV